MDKKLSQLPEKVTSLSADDLLYVSSNGISKSIKASTVEAPLKAYADQKKSEVLTEIDALEASLNSEISNRASGDTSTLNSAKAYADLKKSEVESSLQSAVNSEQSARISADQSLQSQINNILNNADPVALDSLVEVVAAFQSADSNLSGAITNLSNTLTGNLNSEITARISADSNLLSQINQEISDRQTDVSSEESRAIAVENSLQSQITQEISNRVAAVSGEASLRQSADQTLQSQITQEISDRSAGDLDLQNNLNSEITRALSVENSLQTQITQEISDRQAAITQEISDRNTAIYNATTGHIIPRETLVYDLGSPEFRYRDLYLSGSTIILGETTISSNENGELNLQEGATVGGNLIASTNYVDSAVDVEESARISADNSLQTAINNEESSRISADSSLQSQISQEVTDRINGDSTTLSSSQTYTNTVAAALVPAGVISMYAGNTAPSGYLLCDGSAVSRSTYSALFAVVGTTYGSGNGSTTFNLPNPDSNANIKLIIKT